MPLTECIYTGYALGLIVNACVSSQAGKTQPEIAHVSAHFYRATSLGHLEVHIRTMRAGTSYSNLSADLIQKVYSTHSL